MNNFEDFYIKKFNLYPKGYNVYFKKQIKKIK